MNPKNPKMKNSSSSFTQLTLFPVTQRKRKTFKPIKKDSTENSEPKTKNQENYVTLRTSREDAVVELSKSGCSQAKNLKEMNYPTTKPYKENRRKNNQ